MAALVTPLNPAKGKSVGFLNPFLYADAGKGIVHDVTEGTNAITNTVKGYDAGPGWDACSRLMLGTRHPRRDGDLEQLIEGLCPRFFSNRTGPN
jgi:hypothetical protein